MNRKQVLAAAAIGLVLGATWTLRSGVVLAQSQQNVQVPKFRYDPTFPQPLPEKWAIGVRHSEIARERGNLRRHHQSGRPSIDGNVVDKIRQVIRESRHDPSPAGIKAMKEFIENYEDRIHSGDRIRVFPRAHFRLGRLSLEQLEPSASRASAEE